MRDGAFGRREISKISTHGGRDSLKQVRPIVIKIGETIIHPEAMQQVLREVGASEKTIETYLMGRGNGAEALIEFAGRICYESYEPGLNPNVSRVRAKPSEYFSNILNRGDGSILEHGFLTVGILHVSRVCTHEIVRHRVGVAVSQESLRYVRPRDIKFWIPDELDPAQSEAVKAAVEKAEEAYRELERQIPWDQLSMDEKKRLTSALRRILPDGIATNMIWSANHRTLRWLIEMRTDPSAEVEIRMVFDQIADICKRDYPNLYMDFVATDLPDGTKSWKPTIRSKV
jgi:thymidylate synthase (FAD)